jgi:hypothetical protein
MKLTPMEWSLYAWLCMSAAVTLFVVVSGVAPIEVIGTDWTRWLVPIVGTAVTIIFLRRLLAPTWRVLLAAAVFYIFQIVAVRSAGSFYEFQFGPRVMIKIVTEPDLTISLNLMAIICSALYGWAAFLRFEGIEQINDDGVIGDECS